MTVTEFTPLASTIGGALIGVAAVMLMLFNGRIAGISGILGRLFPPYDGADPGGAAAFIARSHRRALGLCSGDRAHRLRRPCPAMSASWRSPDFSSASARPTAAAAPADTACAGWRGCRSRSLIATAIFMTTGFITVFVMRHVVGG